MDDDLRKRLEALGDPDTLKALEEVEASLANIHGMTARMHSSGVTPDTIRAIGIASLASAGRLDQETITKFAEVEHTPETKTPPTDRPQLRVRSRRTARKSTSHRRQK